MLPDGGEITTSRTLAADEPTDADRHRRALVDNFSYNLVEVSFCLDNSAPSGYRSDIDDIEDNSELTAKLRRGRRLINKHRSRTEQKRKCSTKVNGNEIKSYVPSWVVCEPLDDKTHSSVDVRGANSAGHMYATLSDFLEKTVDGSSSSSSKMPTAPHPNDESTRANSKDHQTLEKEYLKLRKDITGSSTDKDDVNKSELNRSLSERSIMLVSTQNGMFDTSDFFSSDDLGINHFRKHIHNVKSTSKKYKRTQRKPDQKGKRVQHFKTFNTVYEQEHSVISDPVSSSHTSRRYGGINQDR